MITRKISEKLLQLSGQYPVVTLTGPRQSGKTTLVKSLFSSKEYVNLELPDNREFALTDPRGFLAQYENGVIIDEAQYAPHLFSYIQGIVDEKQKNGLFILTGSQNFLLSEAISQSLAGRVALLSLLPFSVTELGGIKNKPIDSFLYQGFYPRIYDQKLNPTEALANYLNTYVERDVRLIKNIGDLGLFQNFLKLCAGRAGQLLNYTSLGNDLGVSKTTIRKWLSILETSYIVFTLPPYYSNIRKRLVKSPKIYFYDVGLASYLLGIENESHLKNHPLRGSLYENFIIMEIVKLLFNTGKRSNLSFYRNLSGNEVDLIFPVAHKLIPIEIKSAQTISNTMFKNLFLFEKYFNDIAHKVLIYGGGQSYIRNDVQVLSINNFIDWIENNTSIKI